MMDQNAFMQMLSQMFGGGAPGGVTAPAPGGPVPPGTPGNPAMTATPQLQNIDPTGMPKQWNPGGVTDVQKNVMPPPAANPPGMPAHQVPFNMYGRSFGGPQGPSAGGMMAPRDGSMGGQGDSLDRMHKMVQEFMAGRQAGHNFLKQQGDQNSPAPPAPMMKSRVN